jgi:hypothetical protein
MIGWIQEDPNYEELFMWEGGRKGIEVKAYAYLCQYFWDLKLHNFCFGSWLLLYSSIISKVRNNFYISNKTSRLLL